MVSTAGPGGVQSLHRSLDLLEVIAARGGHLPLAELSEACGVPMATAHRLLRTLVERGYVRQRPDRRYALGFRLVPLGRTAGGLLDDAVHDELAGLVAALGESANLAVLDGVHAQYVAQAPSAYAMRMFTQVGHRVQLHCTGVGKAMLAHLDDDAVADVVAEVGLPRHTEHTVTSPARLRSALARVRADGYAVDEQEQEIGVRCVAVPVLGVGVPMAVSVSGPVTRVDDALVTRAVPALTAAAARIAGGPTATRRES